MGLGKGRGGNRTYLSGTLDVLSVAADERGLLLVGRHDVWFGWVGREGVVSLDSLM